MKNLQTKFKSVNPFRGYFIRRNQFFRIYMVLVFPGYEPIKSKTLDNFELFPVFGLRFTFFEKFLLIV